MVADDCIATASTTGVVGYFLLKTLQLNGLHLPGRTRGSIEAVPLSLKMLIGLTNYPWCKELIEACHC